MPNIEEIFKSIITVLLKNYAYLGAAAILVGVNIFIDTKYWPSSVRFYHPGWVEKNRSWFLLFLACALVSLYVCRNKIGFSVVALLCIALAAFFAVAYPSSQFSEDSWPFVVWLSYRIFLALIVGVAATVVNYLVPKPSGL
jgi:hypothetical protein